MKLFARTTVALLLALAGASVTAEAQDKKKKPAYDRNKLTAEEIRAAPATSTYQLIRSRRGNWLSVRGQASMQTVSGTDPYTGGSMKVGAPAEIVVYIDNVKYGSQESLRSLSTEDVDSIEYLNATSATQRFGTGHAYGAILIRRRGR